MHLILSTLSLLALPLLTLTAPTDDPYPKAQPCFNAATAAAGCDSSHWPTFNACACTNTRNWLGMSAQCIGKNDNDQMGEIYNTLQSNCAGTNTPIVWSMDQWQNAGKINIP